MGMTLIEEDLPGQIGFSCDRAVVFQLPEFMVTILRDWYGHSLIKDDSPQQHAPS